MKIDPVLMYLIIAAVVLVIFLYNRHFSRKQEEAFAAIDLKTIKKHFEGRYIEFKGQKVDLRFPDSEGCKRCEAGDFLVPGRFQVYKV